jgi:hypothetical protein
MLRSLADLELKILSYPARDLDAKSFQNSRLKTFRTNLKAVVSDGQGCDLVTPGVVSDSQARHSDFRIAGSDLGSVD